MVFGHNKGVVGLTGFSCKEMCGLLFKPQKSGRNKGVVVLIWWSHGRVPLYFSNSLITHEEKTKEITSTKEVWICDPNYYHKIR